MKLSRRTFLLGTAASSAATTAGAITAPAVLNSKARRVSQSELSHAIERHAMWLDDTSRGQRAVFSNRDLSGLDFRDGQHALVNLRGSDFTGADLTGITGDNVSFLRASLHGARLSWSRLEQPTFSYASLRNAKCDNVVWGWNDRLLSDPSRAATDDFCALFHTDAGKSDCTRASIRGLFVEACFTDAILAEADLSYSVFYGQRHFETSFFRSNLSRAKFKSTTILAARFKEAICDGIDFTDAEVRCGVESPMGIAAHQTP